MAWGPPMAETMRGRVTKGPTPTMSMTLRPRAAGVERPRFNSVAGVFCGAGFGVESGMWFLWRASVGLVR